VHLKYTDVGGCSPNATEYSCIAFESHKLPKSIEETHSELESYDVVTSSGREFSVPERYEQ